MEDIKELIESKYNINVYKTEKIKNALKIESSIGGLCFKQSKYDIRQFTFIVGAIQHLIDRGFNAVLQFIETKDGEKYIKTEKGYGFLCKWIDSREADYDNPVELKICVETLSTMHLSARDYKCSDIPPVRDCIGKWPERFKKRCSELLYFKTQILGKESKTEFDEIYLKYFDLYYKQAAKSIKDIEDTKYLSIMEETQKHNEFCHHDTANHNFLITKDNSVYMVDFDYCIMDSHLHDLSSIIIRNMKNGNWNFDTLEYILGIYTKKIPVSFDELCIMFCFMEFPQDFWQVGLQYYVEKQPWDEAVFLRKLNRGVRDFKDRMKFLRRFEARLMEGDKCLNENILK